MNSPKVADIVTFRLKDGTHPDAFRQAAEAMTPFLCATGAIVSRALSVEQAGRWTEFILWTSQPEAQAAAKAVFAQPEAGPFMNKIDLDDIAMRHAQAALYLPPD